jgi:hypothetical protein
LGIGAMPGVLLGAFLRRLTKRDSGAAEV